MLIFIHSALYLVYLSLFIWFIYRLRFFDIGLPKRGLTYLFLLKVVAGILLTFIYTYYYTDQSRADIYRYFNDSKIISDVLFQHPLMFLKIMSGIGTYDADAFQYLVHTQNFSHPPTDFVTSNTLIIRINVLLNYLSFSSIHINTLFFNFFAFTGLVAMYKALKNYFHDFHVLLSVPLFLIPSVVFWSSGLLKDALLFTGIGWLLYSLSLPVSTAEKKIWLLRFATILFLWSVKPAVAVCVLIALLFFPHHKVSLFYRGIVFAVAGIIGSIFLFGIYPNASEWLCETLLVKRNEFIMLAQHGKAGSYFETAVTNTKCKEVWSLFPTTLADAIFRPYFWNLQGVFEWLFAIENTVFILVLVYLLLHFKKPDKNSAMLALCFLTFALLNYLMIGLTVPITGAIVHYRSTASPFLMLAVLLCTDKHYLHSVLTKWLNFKK